MMEAINAAELVIRVGRHILLDHVSLSVPVGRSVALVGRSAAGKSIFIRVLLGLFARDEGQLLVCGLDPEVQPKQVRRLTTYVSEPDVLEPHLTTSQNVAHIVSLSGLPTPTRVDIARALRDADVPDRVIDRPASNLTKHLALVIWLAIGRLRGSQLVILDDPTAHLNPSEASHLASLLREFAERGPAVFVATRDERFADEFASAVYVLESGHFSSRSRSRLTSTPTRTEDSGPI